MSLLGQRSTAIWTAVGGVCAVITVVISLVQLGRTDPPEDDGKDVGLQVQGQQSPTAGPGGGGVEPSPSPSPPPPPSTQLDYSLDATYFSEAATFGFSGDPRGFPMASGGPVDAAYVAPGCRGHAAPAPDFQLTWDGNGGLLRFYFVGDGDTALVINAPDTSWHCNDDSNGGLNPTVDFVAAADGSYDVWVASVSSGTSISGTLFVTELESQAPPS